MRGLWFWMCVFPPSLEMMIPLDLGRKHSARRCQQKESCVSAGSYSTCLPAIIARSVFKRCIRTFGGGCFEFASRLRHESHGFFTSFKPIDFDHLISEICGRWACAPENSDVARTFAEAVGSATTISHLHVEVSRIYETILSSERNKSTFGPVFDSFL